MNCFTVACLDNLFEHVEKCMDQEQIEVNVHVGGIQITRITYE